MKWLVRIDGRQVDIAEGDLLEVEPGVFSVLLESRVFEARKDGETLWLNGRRVQADVEDPREFRGTAAGNTAGGIAVLRSTMPGKVVRLLVAPGDHVEAGAGILIIEAMKMQNEVKSPRSGTVTQFKVTADQLVAAGAELAYIE